MGNYHKERYCSRVSVLELPVGNDPFCVLLTVNGSGDLAVDYPCVGVSAHVEPISVFALFLDGPLCQMRWALQSE